MGRIAFRPKGCCVGGMGEEAVAQVRRELSVCRARPDSRRTRSPGRLLTSTFAALALAAGSPKIAVVGDELFALADVARTCRRGVTRPRSALSAGCRPIWVRAVGTRVRRSPKTDHWVSVLVGMRSNTADALHGGGRTAHSVRRDPRRYISSARPRRSPMAARGDRVDVVPGVASVSFTRGGAAQRGGSLRSLRRSRRGGGGRGGLPLLGRRDRRRAISAAAVLVGDHIVGVGGRTGGVGHRSNPTDAFAARQGSSAVPWRRAGAEVVAAGTGGEDPVALGRRRPSRRERHGHGDAVGRPLDDLDRVAGADRAGFRTAK